MTRPVTAASTSRAAIPRVRFELVGRANAVAGKVAPGQLLTGVPEPLGPSGLARYGKQLWNGSWAAFPPSPRAGFPVPVRHEPPAGWRAPPCWERLRSTGR